jgi:hypothetical protein
MNPAAQVRAMLLVEPTQIVRAIRDMKTRLTVRAREPMRPTVEVQGAGVSAPDPKPYA